MYKNVIQALALLSDDNRADSSRWFFKTGPGEYGEGDEFIGVKVPDQRKVAKQFKDLPLPEVQKLLNTPIHEQRLTALLILCSQFAKATELDRKKIYNLYLKNVDKGNVNNWDLVDLSAYKIVGEYLFDKSREPLYELADIDELWHQRVAMMSTNYFIKNDDFGDTLLLAEKLIGNEHDLIHKVVGWMLREVGNRDFVVEDEFLREHYKQMPRTMLRYAIEKFREPIRQAYLKGTV